MAEISFKPGLLFVLFLTGVIFLAESTFAQESGTPIHISLNPNEELNLKKTSLSYEIKPTKSVEDVLTIRNSSENISYTLKIYAVDSLQSSNGAAAFKLAGTDQQHIGKWVIFNQEEITIGPKEYLYLPYRIEIPEKVTPGTYYGGLIAEVITQDLPDKQIKVVPRIVEPIFVSIPGRKNIDFRLNDFSYQQNNGKPSFYLNFTNNGNVFLKGEINLKIEGTLLHKAYEMNVTNPTILQGEVFEKVLLFENPPLFGDYKASLTFNIYEYDVIKNELKLLQVVNKELSFGIVPYGIMLALLVLLILIVLAEKWRRTYLKEELEYTFIHRVGKGENISTIAKTYRLNWRTIAKLNKLRSPYNLIVGQKLLLPFPKSESSPLRTPGLDKKKK